MSCYLWIAGDEFDVDAFLKQTGLEAFDIRHKGQPKYADRADKMIAKRNSCSLGISDAGFGAFQQQVDDAISYLAKHYEQLKYIVGYTGVEYADIQFGMYGTPDKPVQSVYYPPELVQLAGQLGLSLDVAIYNPDFFEGSG